MEVRESELLGTTAVRLRQRIPQRTNLAVSALPSPSNGSYHVKFPIL